MKILSNLKFCPKARCPHSNSRGELYMKTIRREYRRIRYIYYCILPRLLFYLRYPPDRALILELEETYWHWLNTAMFVSGRRNAVYRLRLDIIT